VGTYNTEELLRLVRDNPDLRIIPMVDTEVVYDDSYSSWAGAWGYAYIDDLYVDELNGSMKLRSMCFDELVESTESDIEIEYEIESVPLPCDEEVERMATNRVNQLEWEKIIVVNIETL
jgi:hypothetical protein